MKDVYEKFGEEVAALTDNESENGIYRFSEAIERDVRRYPGRITDDEEARNAYYG